MRINIQRDRAAGAVLVTVPYLSAWSPVAAALGGQPVGTQGNRETWTFPESQYPAILPEIDRLYPTPPEERSDVAVPEVALAAEVDHDPLVRPFAAKMPRPLLADGPPDRWLRAVPDYAAGPTPFTPHLHILPLADGDLAVMPAVNDVGIPGVRFRFTPHQPDRPPAEFIVSARSWEDFNGAVVDAYQTAVDLPPQPAAAVRRHPDGPQQN